eukprot:Skav220453  [mRNA]  locus=scaffold254:192147:193813:+ [translate_table: standard]
MANSSFTSVPVGASLPAPTLAAGVKGSTNDAEVLLLLLLFAPLSSFEAVTSVAFSAPLLAPASAASPPSVVAANGLGVVDVLVCL